VASNASPRTVDGNDGFLSGVGVVVVVVGGGGGVSADDDASAAAPILAVRVRFLMGCLRPVIAVLLLLALETVAPPKTTPAPTGAAADPKDVVATPPPSDQSVVVALLPIPIEDGSIEGIMIGESALMEDTDLVSNGAAAVAVVDVAFHKSSDVAVVAVVPTPLTVCKKSNDEETVVVVVGAAAAATVDERKPKALIAEVELSGAVAVAAVTAAVSTWSLEVGEGIPPSVDADPKFKNEKAELAVAAPAVDASLLVPAA
jgi:hypothetical protein